MSFPIVFFARGWGKMTGKAKRKGRIMQTIERGERRALWVELPSRPRPSSGRRWPWLAALVIVATLLVFNHGCHGEDVDDELFSRGWWVTMQK